VATDSLDPDALLLNLIRALGTDRVDLVDLDRAGAQIRYRAAAEGRVVHEGRPRAFSDFWLAAVDFWCDAEPVLRGERHHGPPGGEPGGPFATAAAGYCLKRSAAKFWASKSSATRLSFSSIAAASTWA
jgi:hypothetical protein